MREVEKGAVCSPQAGDKLWIVPYRRCDCGRKPTVADVGGQSTESTSGVADLGALRGAPGEASPRPWVVGRRKRPDRPTVPNAPARLVQTRSWRPSFGSPALPVNSRRAPKLALEPRAGRGGRPAQADRTGARRSEHVVRLRFVARDSRSRVCVAGSFASWFGSGWTCDQRCRIIHPISERPRDGRCSSGSSLGKALSRVRMPAQRTRRPRVS